MGTSISIWFACAFLLRSKSTIVFYIPGIKVTNEEALIITSIDQWEALWQKTKQKPPIIDFQRSFIAVLKSPVPITYNSSHYRNTLRIGNLGVPFSDKGSAYVCFRDTNKEKDSANVVAVSMEKRASTEFVQVSILQEPPLPPGVEQQIDISRTWILDIP